MKFSYWFYKCPIPIGGHENVFNPILPLSIFKLPLMCQYGFESINFIIFPIVIPQYVW